MLGVGVRVLGLERVDRSIAVSSSVTTSVLNEVTSELAISLLARAQLGRRSCPSSRPAPHATGGRPWTPVNVSRACLMSRSQRRRERGAQSLAAQLVEHGAVDAGPRVLLERGALLRVVAVDRADQASMPHEMKSSTSQEAGSSRIFL